MAVSVKLTLEQSLEVYGAVEGALSLLDKWDRLVHTTEAERDLYTMRAVILRMASTKLRKAIEDENPTVLRHREGR